MSKVDKLDVGCHTPYAPMVSDTELDDWIQFKKIQINARMATSGLLLNDTGPFAFTIRYSLEVFQISLMEHKTHEARHLFFSPN